MTDEKPDKKISDNPSTEEMKALLPALQAVGSVAGLLGRLGFKKEKLSTFAKKVKEITTQAGAVRRMRTGLSSPPNAGPYGEQIWRHSERAAARLALKLARV